MLLVPCKFSQFCNDHFQVQKAFALSTSGKLVACACNNGAVQLFTPMSLEYLGNILYSEETAIEQDFQKLLALPDAVACQFSGLEKLGECYIFNLINLIYSCISHLHILYFIPYSGHLWRS